MKQPYRVLVFPAGTEIGLEIVESLRHCKEVELIGAGQGISNHGPFVCERFHALPSIHERGWVSALNQVIALERIDFIMPAYDDVIVALAREEVRIGASIVSSPASTCEITRSKSATYGKLAGRVRVPRLYDSVDAVDRWPVFAKPDRGQGAQGALRLDDADSARAALAERADRILCEYLPGEEYTVDCFSDREAGLLFCGARERIRTRNGISVHSRTVKLPGIRVMAEAIAATLPLHGAWFFQVKRAEYGELALMEVAPRIAGAMAVHRVQGINFALLSIYESLRVPIDLITLPTDVEIDRALRNRYQHWLRYRNVYMDLDDTLLLRGQVNADLVRFIFQCHNRGIPVRLITRHAGDLPATLARHRLTGLFDEVIHIKGGEEKHAHITAPGAIFIDDSYGERRRVHAALGIPVLDCSMVELLAEGRTVSARERTNSSTEIPT